MKKLVSLLVVLSLIVMITPVSADAGTDIYNWLTGSLFQALYDQFLTPVLAIILHGVNILYTSFATVINLLINMANLAMNIYSMIANLFNLYFTYFPTAWSDPLVAGIISEVLVAAYWFFKRHIPTVSGD